jgi:hypothetical protein
MEHKKYKRPLMEESKGIAQARVLIVFKITTTSALGVTA